MQIIKLIIGLIALSSNCFCCLEVTAFDVGQGNCTLVGYKDDSHSVPPILIDCGSTNFTFRGKQFYRDQIAAIGEKIEQYTSAMEKATFLVVVSHPDTDHYNWLKALILKVRKGTYKIWPEAIYLGGSEMSYNSKKCKDFNKWLRRELESTKIIYVTYDENEGKYKNTNGYMVLTRFPSNSGGCVLLPALAEEKKDKNKASLVVQISFYTRSCLIMGDANGKTTTHLLKTVPELCKTDVYLASHHGSKEEGCNSDEWLNAVRPRIAVLSAGFMYKHPRAEVIQRLDRFIEEKRPPSYHVVLAGIGDANDSMACRWRGKTLDGYGLVILDKHLYTTTSQGTISLTFEKGVDVIKIERELDEDTSVPVAALTEILEMRCTSASKDYTIISQLKSLDLSTIGLKDTDEDERNALHELLDMLIEEGKSINSVNFAYSEFTLSETCEKIKALLRGEQITQCNLEGSLNENLTPEELKAIWNNRGLNLGEN